MAILYVLTINDPNNVGPFPPEILNGNWYNNTFLNITNFQSIGGNTGYTYAWVFPDLATLNAWVSNNKPTDPDDIATLANWQTFGVQYQSTFYEIPSITAQGLI